MCYTHSFYLYAFACVLFIPCQWYTFWTFWLFCPRFFFSAMLMLPSHAGQRTRCVTGCRSRVSAFMWTWLVCGSPLDRRCYRPHNRTWRGWDEAEEFNKFSKAGRQEKYSRCWAYYEVPQGCRMQSLHIFLWMFRSWESNTRCTERSCSWLCRPSALRRRTIRESWTITGWRVSASCQSKTWASCWLHDVCIYVSEATQKVSIVAML